MTTPRFEAFLATLYVDADLRRRFVADARATAAAAGLDAGQIEALAQIDLVGLELAARSYAAKRESMPARKPSRLARVFRFWDVDRRRESNRGQTPMKPGSDPKER